MLWIEQLRVLHSATPFARHARLVTLISAQCDELGASAAYGSPLLAAYRTARSHSSVESFAASSTAGAAAARDSRVAHEDVAHTASPPLTRRVTL